jgi:hypothetical protein
MSEYELSLLRQRGIASRDWKALRGELRFRLPPGYCWNEIGQIDMDPDERVNGAIRLVFDKFQELGSARQVLLWAKDQDLQLPIIRRNNSSVCKIEWRPAAYHTLLQILRHPSMPAPMSSAARPSARALSRGGLVRPPVTQSQWRPGMSYCAISPGLHQPGTVRSKPEADLGERAYAAPDRTQINPRRPGSTDRIGALRPLWPHDAGVLRFAIRPRSSLPLPRRRQSRRRLAVHPHRRRPDRSCRRRRHPSRGALGKSRQRDPGGRFAGSSRRQGTRPPWPPDATNSSTWPSVWSRANLKSAGTQLWSGSLISRIPSSGMMLLQRFAPRSIARP